MKKEEEKELIPVFDEEEASKKNAKIKVIGVGGGGCNAVKGMLNDKADIIDYWLLNTDEQALANAPATNKYVLGRNVTGGLGAGGKPERGQQAAEASYDDIKLIVKGANMVFIAAGEGGGTGSGAAPVVARAARESGALVVGIVTRPFDFEGKTRKSHALEGIHNLQANVDAIIVVSNDKLLFNNSLQSFDEAFDASDNVLASCVKTVTDVILKPGRINLDFADVQTILENKGLALIGIGRAKGPNKAIEAADNAINSPLLESSFNGARSMLVNVTYSCDTSLADVSSAIEYIEDKANSTSVGDNNLILGAQKDETLEDEMLISIIATDFDKEVDGIPVGTNAHDTLTDGLKPAIKTPKPVETKPVSTSSASILPGYLSRFLDENKVDDKEEEKPVEKKPEIVSDDDEETVVEVKTK